MKNILIVFCTLIISTNVVSQEVETKINDSTKTANSKLKFGCGFGLNFVGSTNISISPNLMYTLSDKFTIGAGLQGSYAAIKDIRNTTTFGANIIGFYKPAKKLTLLLEFVELNVTNKTETIAGQIKNTFWDSALFTGAGFNITSKILVGAKYNMLYKEEESVYTSAVVPFVNISF